MQSSRIYSYFTGSLAEIQLKFKLVDKNFPKNAKIFAIEEKLTITPIIIMNIQQFNKE